MADDAVLTAAAGRKDKKKKGKVKGGDGEFPLTKAQVMMIAAVVGVMLVMRVGYDDGSKAKLPLTNALSATASDLGVLRSPDTSSQAAGEAATEGGRRSNSREKNKFANPKELKKAIDALTDDRATRLKRVVT